MLVRQPRKAPVVLSQEEVSLRRSRLVSPAAGPARPNSLHWFGKAARITASVGRAGPPVSDEISATGRGPPRARVRPTGRPWAESSRLDDFNAPIEQTFSRPAAPRRRGNPCVDSGPEFGPLVPIEAAQIVDDSLHQRIGRQGSSPFCIILTDDCERRRIVLCAGYLFRPVDRALDRFDLIVTEPQFRIKENEVPRWS